MPSLYCMSVKDPIPTYFDVENLVIPNIFFILKEYKTEQNRSLNRIAMEDAFCVKPVLLNNYS
ncbi:MAG: hypothetical protein K0Q56_201 [Sporolactobacillus laevolacticus]|nr:hypothetical protein [Sporolactobacillus laevolacticus]